MPPLAKNSRTLWLRSLSGTAAPKVREKSARLRQRTAVFIGPLAVRPRKAAMEVATPVMVWTPLGTSTT